MQNVAPQHDEVSVMREEQFAEYWMIVDPENILGYPMEFDEQFDTREYAEGDVRTFHFTSQQQAVDMAMKLINDNLHRILKETHAFNCRIPSPYKHKTAPKKEDNIPVVETLREFRYDVWKTSVTNMLEVSGRTWDILISAQIQERTTTIYHEKITAVVNGKEFTRKETRSQVGEWIPCSGEPFSTGYNTSVHPARKVECGLRIYGSQYGVCWYEEGDKITNFTSTNK
jgi:hypothetical protein